MENNYTWTNDTGIFAVVTVVFCYCFVWTLGQNVFTFCAFHVIQQDGVPSLTKRGRTQGPQSSATVQLPADDRGIFHVPSVVTHRSPTAGVKDFNSAGATSRAWAAQPDVETWWRRIKTGYWCSESSTITNLEVPHLSRWHWRPHCGNSRVP